MARPAFEVADIFRLYGEDYRAARRLPLQQQRVMRAIEVCRTAVLGGHVERCGHCAYCRTSFNSCRNRHCPKCQNTERARWLLARQDEVLPAPYFHVVFTVPEQIARIALQNKETVYGILFRTAARALLTIGGDPRHLGAELGFFAVLHTWGQNLLHHPHLHCVIPGGGLSADHQRWIACLPGFFLPVRVLSRLFRRLFLEAVEAAFAGEELRFFGELAELRQPAAFAKYLAPLRRAEWVVYAKPPFGGPSQVLEYLGRYTHRVAISNQRLLSVGGGQVTFQWKDYRSAHQQHQRTMTLQSEEFIRRFLLHTLPQGFQRIRYFGFMANRHRRCRTALCRALLTAPVPELLPQPEDTARFLRFPAEAAAAEKLPVRCPHCGTGTMIRVLTLDAWRWPARPPPAES